MSVIAIGTFMTTLDMGVLRIALPALAVVFGIDAESVLWISLVYLLAGTGLMLTLGRAGDAFGRKRIFTSGILIFTIGLGLCATTQNFVVLVIFRVIQAIGGTMMAAMGSAILIAAFPDEEKGRALGIMEAVVGMGLLSGPILGGLLLDTLDWRSMFLLRVPIGAIGLIMAWFLLKEVSLPRSQNRFDFIGAATLFGGLTCLLLALNRGNSLGWGSPLVLSLIGIGLVFSLLFLVIEWRLPHPVLDLRLFRSRLFSVAAASHLLLTLVTGMFHFLLPFFFIQGLGYSPSLSGVLVAVISAMSLLISPLSGHLSDRLGTFSICALGMTLMSAGILLFGQFSAGSSVWMQVFYMVVIGVGLWLFIPPNSSAIMGSVPKERLGTAAAMVGTVRQIGQSVGIALAGSIFAVGKATRLTELADSGMATEMAQRLATIKGFEDSMWAALAVALVGLVVSLLRGRG